MKEGLLGARYRPVLAEVNEGAREAGLRTAFVDRPREYGPGSAAREDPDADESVGDLLELAERLAG